MKGAAPNRVSRGLLGGKLYAGDLEEHHWQREHKHFGERNETMKSYWGIC